MGYPRVEEEQRRTSERWDLDEVPTTILRPDGKRTMAEVVHVAATRLVCKRREHTWVGNQHGVPSQDTGGPGSGCGDIFVDMCATQHSNVCRRTAVTDTQLLEHSEESGLDHENRLLWRGAWRVRVTSMHPSLLSSIAGNRVRW